MWRLIAGQHLRCHSWGAESVLYNDLTGDTHLLGEDAIFLLHALQAAPHSEARLAAALCGAGAADADADAAAETAALLASLCTLSLVERIAC
jgi:PqqD family protein of HPr-rel-A system